jgi:nucleotide-binding universal stress UspA family protein
VTALRTILVPVAGSSGGAHALASAVALAAAANARLVLMRVVVPLLAYQTGDAWIYGAGLYVDPVRDDEALAAAKCYTAALADRLRSTGVRAESAAVIGGAGTPSTSIVEGIIAAADRVDADLIVMSTHAHTGPARLLLGSVADALVRRADRPVLLVRRSGAAEAQAEADGPPLGASARSATPR